MGVPQNGWSIREHLLKMGDLGVPPCSCGAPFLKTRRSVPPDSQHQSARKSMEILWSLWDMECHPFGQLFLYHLRSWNPHFLLSGAEPPTASRAPCDRGPAAGEGWCHVRWWSMMPYGGFQQNPQNGLFKREKNHKWMISGYPLGNLWKPPYVPWMMGTLTRRNQSVDDRREVIWCVSPRGNLPWLARNSPVRWVISQLSTSEDVHVLFSRLITVITITIYRWFSHFEAFIYRRFSYDITILAGNHHEFLLNHHDSPVESDTFTTATGGRSPSREWTCPRRSSRLPWPGNPGWDWDEVETTWNLGLFCYRWLPWWSWHFRLRFWEKTWDTPLVGHFKATSRGVLMMHPTAPLAIRASPSTTCRTSEGLLQLLELAVVAERTNSTWWYQSYFPFETWRYFAFLHYSSRERGDSVHMVPAIRRSFLVWERRIRRSHPALVEWPPSFMIMRIIHLCCGTGSTVWIRSKPRDVWTAVFEFTLWYFDIAIEHCHLKLIYPV